MGQKLTNHRVVPEGSIETRQEETERDELLGEDGERGGVMRGARAPPDHALTLDQVYAILSEDAGALRSLSIKLASLAAQAEVTERELNEEDASHGKTERYAQCISRMLEISVMASVSVIEYRGRDGVSRATDVMLEHLERRPTK